MNDLRTPRNDDADLHASVIHALDAMMNTAPSPQSEPTEANLLGRHEPAGHRSRTLVATAAAGVLGLGVAGLVVINQLDDPAVSQSGPQPSDTSPVADEPEVDGEPAIPSADPVTMVLPELPDGLRVVGTTAPTTRRGESQSQRFLYGATDDPGDPARMMAIEFDPSGASVIPCHSFLSMPDPQGSADDFDPAVWQAAATPVEGSIRFTVPVDGASAATGAACVGPNGLAQAGWFVDGAAIGLAGGDLVGTDLLIELAQGIDVTDAAAVDVAANSLSYDLRPLVTGDVAYLNEISETAWIASNATVTDVEREQAAAEGRPVDEPGELGIWTWYGGDESAVYAIASPLGAERISVRGHPGYLFASQDEVQIWWAENEDLVVRVRSNNLYNADEIMALAEELRPASDAEFNRAVVPSD